MIALYIVAYALLSAVIWHAFSRAENAPFIYDDRSSVVDNTSLRHLSPLLGDSNMTGPLRSAKELPTSGRPLLNLSFALNYHFGQLGPAGYRRVNLVLHFISMLLLAAIVRRTLTLQFFAGRFSKSAPIIAFCTAMLWAIHPLQTEPVIYVTQRSELLVGLFYLATLYASLRYWAAETNVRRRTWLVVAISMCACGMASKEVMVTAPVVVFIFERTLIAGTIKKAWQNSWSLYIGLALTWLVLLALNYDGPRSGSAGFHVAVSPVAYWFTQAKVLLLYLKLVVWPNPLAIRYEIPYLDSISAAWVYVPLVMLLAVGTIAILSRNNALGFVGSWVLLILAPTSIVPIITEVAAERRMYLPLAALAASVTASLYLACSKMLSQRRSAANAQFNVCVSSGTFVAICFTIMCVYMLLDIDRATLFNDPLALWRYNLIYQPDDAMALTFVGDNVLVAGRPQEAIKNYREAIIVNPDYPEAHNNLANAFFATGQRQQAIEEFRETLRLNEGPRNFSAYSV